MEETYLIPVDLRLGSRARERGGNMTTGMLVR